LSISKACGSGGTALGALSARSARTAHEEYLGLSREKRAEWGGIGT